MLSAKTNFRRFYYLLKYFLQNINTELAKLPLEKAEHVAEQKCKPCNNVLSQPGKI